MKLQSTPYSRARRYLADGVISGVAFALAYLIRFEGRVPAEWMRQMWLLLPFVMLSRFAINIAFRLYWQIWRYVSIVDLFRIGQSYVAFSVV